ncbi:MAG: serine/threonine protein kinase [Bacilli bacterium]|nr:serine/threonine protein kinase [Bacilli bacterium]
MLKIDDFIDGYRITGRLGSGGMAEVYQASDFYTKKLVAIKIIKEELCKDKVQLERFNNEAAFCADLQHPNIIKVYSRGVFEDRPYVAYEYIKDDTLLEKIAIYSHYSLKESCMIMIQLCDAIGYIHDSNIVHRDIKPSNVFYLSNGIVKVGDFGISCTITEGNMEEEKEKIVGSVHYLAPELCRGHKPTVQSDIYALGITFFEMLTGTPPFAEGSANDIAKAHIKKAIPSVHEYVPELNKNVDYVIGKACAKNPQDRYSNCMEFKKDIQALLDNKDNFTPKRNIIKRIFGLK